MVSKKEGRLRSVKRPITRPREAKRAPAGLNAGGVPSIDAQRKEGGKTAPRRQAELARLGRLVAMGELAAALAHELSQPLAAIVTNAQASRRLAEAGISNSEEIHDILGDIVEDGKRAGAIIRHIREFLRESSPERNRLQMNEVIQEAAPLLRTCVRQYGATVRFDLADGLPPVLGNRIQLQQVLLNLVRNGLEAMADTCIEPKLTIRTSADANSFARVSVRDAGVGLTEEARRRMAEPFFTTKSDGFGMGLAISNSIVEAHGGRLWATPNSDRGTTLHFVLPCAKECPVP